MFGYLLMGGAHMLHGTTLSTSLQLRVDEEFRGRVMSVFLVAILSGIPIGGLAFGVLGDLVGLRWVVLGAGLALWLDVAVTARRGAFALLDREVEEAGGPAGAPTGGSAGPFADSPDSGDDRSPTREEDHG
jgi:hypothetical protein